MAGVALSTLLYSAFRIAGVTDRPGRTPSNEQFADAIPMTNRMLGSWQCDRLKIYDQSIDSYPLVSNQKVYTLGNGAVTPTNLSTLRPEMITQANIVVNNVSPYVRFQLNLLTDQQNAAICVQDIPGTIPWALYNDGGYPYCTLSLYGQPLTTYLLETYTWEALPSFTATTDMVILPPGYENAITLNLGVLIAASFPTQSHMSPLTPQLAREALAAIKSVNAPSPIMACDGAIVAVGQRRGRNNYYGYLGNDF